MFKIIGAAATAIALFVGVFVWFVGSNNPETPAGYVGYLTQGAVFGKTKFIGLQKGPTSPGRTWLAAVTNVSITPYTYDEVFDKETTVMASDNLKLAFQVHLVWKVDENKVQEFVEHYSYLKGGQTVDDVTQVAYNNYLKEPLRTFAREEVQKFPGLEAKSHLAEIGAAISKQVKDLTASTPFLVTSVVVGNLQPPAEVVDEISKKVAATERLKRMQTEIDIAEKDRSKRVVEARGIAEAMEIINVRLTGAYLQHEAIEAQKAMVGSPNHTTIYIPVGPNGVPLVGTLNAAGNRPEK